MDLLRVVLDARRISPTAATNSLTIKDTPENVAAAGRVIAAIDKARPEVVVDVELLEVDRSKMQEYGLQIASPGSPGINGSISIAADANATTSLQTLRNLTASDVLLSNLPTLYYRLLKSDTNTRTLANPQIRMLDGTTAVARFGDRVPVPQTTFLPIATGGAPQQPLTSYAYEDTGVNIDITPRLHHDDDVSLLLKVSIRSISGTGFGGAPIIGNREINTTISLKDGETNMLAGLIRDDERRVMEGVPGLSDLPVLGRHLLAREHAARSDRHHPHAHAAHYPRAGRIGGRPARVPRRTRFAHRPGRSRTRQSMSCRRRPLGRAGAAASSRSRRCSRRRRSRG